MPVVNVAVVNVAVVNVGTAANLFSALKSLPETKGLDFSKAVAFMSDTTNVMEQDLGYKSL